MRTFYISDIHGNFCVFKKLLDHVKFDPTDDNLVIGGDMINRGPKSSHVLQWAKENASNYPDTIHVIAGNHEEMMIWFIKELSPMWMEFGGDEAIKSFKRVYGDENGWDVAERYATWLEKLPLLYEDEHAIYVRAGIDVLSDKANQPRDIMWMNKKELKQIDKKALMKWSNGKPIFRGHNPFSTVHVEEQFVCADLGSGIIEDDRAALALVEVNENRYYRCNMEGEITVHAIEGIKQ